MNNQNALPIVYCAVVDLIRIPTTHQDVDENGNVTAEYHTHDDAVIWCAVGDAGDLLATGQSKSEDWARLDAVNDEHLAIYAEAYKDGYRLSWLGMVVGFDDFCRLLRRLSNQPLPGSLADTWMEDAS